jgi:ferrous-iron efflux pump FieF
MTARPEDKARLMRLATYAATGTAGLLVVIKLTAWAMTGSLALLSSLIDSLLDSGASLVNLFAVRHALQPADYNYRFGHGKAEPLAGLAQSAFVAGSAIFLLIEISGRFFNPTPVVKGEVGIAVMLLSVLATLGLVAFQKHVVKQTGSVAVEADSLHYTGDVLINGSVIVSLMIGMHFDWPYADPIFAGAIALYLIKSAWEIANSSLSLLMDRELPNEDREKIIDIALDHPEVKGVHDLRTRSSGPQSFIQLHLVMDGDLSLKDAHAVADLTEHKIRAAFPYSEVIIHQDPTGLNEDHPEFN